MSQSNPVRNYNQSLRIKNWTDLNDSTIFKIKTKSNKNHIKVTIWTGLDHFISFPDFFVHLLFTRRRA